MASKILVRCARRGIALALLAALFGCGGGGGGGDAAVEPVAVAPQPQQAPQVAPEPIRCDITLYGDSILAGVYLDDNGVGQTWPLHAAISINLHRPKYRVVDKSQPGQSLYALTLDIYNQQRDTKFVVVESGVIDSWVAEPIGPRLMGLVQFLQAEGRKVIITGFARQAVKTGKFFWLTQDQIDFHDEWNEAARYVAQQTGSTFADWGAVAFNGESDIIDAVHPAEAYSLRLADSLIAAMDRAAPECR